MKKSLDFQNFKLKELEMDGVLGGHCPTQSGTIGPTQQVYVFLGFIIYGNITGDTDQCP